jgi:hypothetical protein
MMIGPPPWLLFLRHCHDQSGFTETMAAAFEGDRAAQNTLLPLGVRVRCRPFEPRFSLACFANGAPQFREILRGSSLTEILRHAPDAIAWPPMRFPFGMSRGWALPREVAMLRDRRATAEPPPAPRGFLGNIEKVAPRYRMTPEQLMAMYDGQDGCCAVCERPLPLVPDHCHDTNRVRGLLCITCNTASGQLKDSPVLAQRLANHLRGLGAPTPRPDSPDAG